MNWNHIILEGFCLRQSMKPGKFIYKVIDTKTLKVEKIPNPFIKKGVKYRTPKKPRFCLNKICYDCFENNCPHLAVGRPPEYEYRKIMKRICEIYK